MAHGFQAWSPFVDESEISTDYSNNAFCVGTKFMDVSTEIINQATLSVQNVSSFEDKNMSSPGKILGQIQ